MLNLSLLEERQELTLPDQDKDLSGKKLLVTGAAGFIGGALFKRLVEYQLDVVGTVLYEEEVQSLREKGYRVDILDLASDENWDDLPQGIDVVFNITALFQEVENSEAMYHKVNVDGTLKLLKTAHRVGVERFVHCSKGRCSWLRQADPLHRKNPLYQHDIYNSQPISSAFRRTYTLIIGALICVE